MVHVSQVIFGLLATFIPRPGPKPQLQVPSDISSNEPKLVDSNVRLNSGKSIAIVGAGSAGLAVLDTLLRYKEEHQTNWTITLFEQRRDVGGIWLPNERRATPPHIPKTPLYPNLRTNTPVPSMTYPGPKHTFPEGTPLYPSYEHVEEYHRRYAQQQGLYPYIKLNHTVISTQWIGDAMVGRWTISYTHTRHDDDDKGTVEFGHFDHLVVGAGNNHFPHLPSWPGQDAWLAQEKHRKITHSVWFYLPEEYKGSRVLVVGSRSSGVDLATQIAPFAEVHISTRGQLERDTDPRVVVRPEISHFTPNAIVFKDNTTYEADVVLLCTGYDLRFPFLEANATLQVVNPNTPGKLESSQPNLEPLTSNLTLKSNLRYIYPLHDHIFSLDPSYPVTALSFVGLPIFVSNCPSDIAQSLYLAHVLANPSILPPRPSLLSRLASQHAELRKGGHDPYYVGHRLLGSYSFDYQDDLIEYLKDRGLLRRDGRKFVEDWRREIHEFTYLRRGWIRVEKLGIEDKWLAGVSNETEWVWMMRRLNSWEKEQEALEGYV